MSYGDILKIRMSTHKIAKKETKFPILVTIILIILIANTIRAINDLRSSQKRLEDIKTQIIGMTAKNAKVKEDIQYVQSDEYLEKASLEKLKLTKPGHHILIIDENDINKKQTSNANPKTIKTWKLWLKEFNLLE